MDTAVMHRLQPYRPHRNQPGPHPAWGADVERAFAIFRQAEHGHLEPLYRFYDDLYDRDATLQNQINVRRDAIASLPVEIQTGDADDEAAEDLAKRFRKVWKRLDWERLLRHHQFGPAFYGFAATEFDWGRGPDGTIDPMDCVHVRAHAFKVAQSHNVEGHPIGALVVRTENGYELPDPARWLITEWDDLRPVAANGLMRASSVLSIVKSRGLANWIRLIQRHGLPFLMALIADWSDEATKDAVRSALSRLGEIPGILLPKKSKTVIDRLDVPPINSKAHREFIEYLDNTLAKLWNGAQLITEVGNSAGNYTVANNHRDARYALLAADKRRIERSWNRLVRQWMQVNGIRDVAAPRVDIGLAELQYATEVIGQAKILHGMGIYCDPAQLRALVGLRPGESRGDEEP